MDPTTEILLPDEVWSRIFKHINPKTLMKLRNVSVELMNLIEKFGGWKTLFFDSSTLAPWRNQLCEMYDPKLTSNEYNSQPDSFYNKLIAFYFSWKSLGKAKKQRVALATNKYDMFDDCDSNGNYLLITTMSDEWYIIDENTLDLVAGPVSYSELEAEIGRIQEIIIWRPESSYNMQKRKLFVIVIGDSSLSIWDVDKKIYLPLSQIIKDINGNSSPLKRVFRSENDIFIRKDHLETGQFDIVKLIWNYEKKIIDGRIVFKLTNHPDSRYRYYHLNDVYSENSKIMVVFYSEGNFYFTQAEIPKGSDEPRVMTFVPNSAQFKQIFHDCHIEQNIVHVRIHNSNVITAYDEKDFYVVIKTETQTGEYDFVTKSIHGSNQILHISDCVFKFDVLFILTKQGKLRVYTYKNINHLIDIDLLTDQVKEIETKNRGALPKVKLITRNHIPNSLIFYSVASDILLLSF